MPGKQCRQPVLGKRAMTDHNAPRPSKSQTQETAHIHYPALDIGVPTHITYTHGGLMMINWHECTYVEAARRLNQLGSRTVRGRLWTASNLRSFTRRHGITRELHIPPMQKVVDVPGIPKEYAIPSLVPVLEVTNGMRSPHVITRIIEKGDEEALARLRDAVRTDPVVRSEVLALAPNLLDHPWAGPEYHEFLDLARTSGHSD